MGKNKAYYTIRYLENLKENPYGWVTMTLILIITIQGVPGGMCQTSGDCSLS